MMRKVELLAPAGGEEQLIAAVENGADAVYLGGTLYNARMNAANFDDEAMQRCLDYAHKRGAKVFVTMNTLLWDDELEDAVEYARKLYVMGADALIIQDLGLGRMISREMPDFPLHLSTQATVSDAWGVRAAAALGYKRVVLSRELSLSEINEITTRNECDIEVFIHGALCICYSGQCQLSRRFGGRSGNRGECAQPCRLPYTVTAGGTRSQSYFLSPKDVCMIDHIGELIEAGVASFKIEGRMKSPEYVAVVTSIYRKYIDEYYRKGSYTVSEEDRLALAQIFNRGGFIDGYYNGDPGKALMCTDVPKHHGVLAGRVVRTKKGSQLIDIELTGPNSIDLSEDGLSLGDGVEIRRPSKEGKLGTIVESRIVTYLAGLAGSGQRLRIGDFRNEIRPGDIVYRTSSKAQLEAARSTYNKPQRKRTVDMVLYCYGGRLKLKAEAIGDRVDPEGDWPSLRSTSVTVEAGPFAAAATLTEDDSAAIGMASAPDVSGRATPRERYAAALNKTGSTPFTVRNLSLKGDFDIIVKASEINELRRRCLNELEDKLCFRRELPAVSRESHDERKAFLKDDEFITVPLAEICMQSDRLGISLEEVFEKYNAQSAKEKAAAAIPGISAVPKGREAALIEERFNECAELCRKRGLVCGSLGWMKRFADAGVRVTAGRGINITNRAAVQAAQELGAISYLLSNEACEEPEPLMITEHDFGECMLEGNRGQKLRIVRYPYSDKSFIVEA